MEWQTKQIRRTYNRLGLGMRIPVDLSVFIVAADAGGKAAVPAAAVVLVVWVAVGGTGAVCDCFAGLLVDCKKC